MTSSTGNTDDVRWYDPDWPYRRRITLPTGTTEAVPTLITIQDAALNTGTDSVLFTSADGVTRISHEVAHYDAATGELHAWVAVPDENPVVYLYYGNADGAANDTPAGVWDEDYRLVLHLDHEGDTYHDATPNGQIARAQGTVGQDRSITVPYTKPLNIADAITVEAWVDADDPRPEAIQTIAARWKLRTDFDAFDAYDAGSTDGLKSRGFFGAVSDGRYIYFVPQHDGTRRHGTVLRYDTHAPFKDATSWSAYDASATDGLDTRGYYGGIFDGRYVYFIPRTDGAVFHSRFLRYDTHGEFTASTSWTAHDPGDEVSHQSAAFDGRYIYFAPGYEGVYLGPGLEGATSGKILRYDTQGDFHDQGSYVTYDAGNTSGLECKCYDGAVFDGRYVYFAPLDAVGIMLRYDTQGEFSASTSWVAYDAGTTAGLPMGRCVGAAYDGRYVYYVPYASSVVVRYDTHGDFTAGTSWHAYDASVTSGMKTKGYDGVVFDGRFVYFIPYWGGEDVRSGHHGKIVRYDTQHDFTDPAGWIARDAGLTDGLRTVGFNAAAFDGRYIYCAPWIEGNDPATGFISHGHVLRYDTTGTDASFSLKYGDYGHNGGLCGALPGPSFAVNTANGVVSVSAHRILTPGPHYLAGIYDGATIQLYIDGELSGEHSGTGTIQQNEVDLTIGRIPDGLGQFTGRISELRISATARDAAWIAANHQALSVGGQRVSVGAEERGSRDSAPRPPNGF